MIACRVSQTRLLPRSGRAIWATRDTHLLLWATNASEFEASLSSGHASSQGTIAIYLQGALTALSFLLAIVFDAKTTGDQCIR
ncbi:hypothetical protein V2G26_013530 [Clonostachys chloroleuca]